MDADDIAAQAGRRARELFLSGMNCAESVLKASMEQLGEGGEWVPRVASGFGSGIARTGGMCGAVSGSIMALGWIMGRNTQADPSDPLYDKGAALIEDFVEKFGTTTCKKLIGVELSDPVERQIAKDKGYFLDCCAPLVEFCGEWVARNLDDAKGVKP